MAVNAATTWEVRTTGAATNGGGFNPNAGGASHDYSQQDSAQYALTGLTSSGAGNVVLTSSAAADMLGNTIQIRSGTNFTPGFFEITSVSVGVSITCSTNQAGTAITVGVGATGVGNIGGAYKFGTSTDSIWSAGVAPGNTTWIKAGTYTQNTSLAITDSTATHQSFITGYNTTRGDNPTGSNRPVLNLAGTSNDFGSISIISYLIFTGTAVSPVTSDGEMAWYNCKFLNTSATTGHNAVTAATDDLFVNCEFVSQAGNGLSTGGNLTVNGCYFHDSPVGIKSTATGFAVNIANNIIAGCAIGINNSGANTSISLIAGNTIYGSERIDGTGISVATGNSNTRIMNNSFYGLATGISAATSNTANWSLTNNYYNCTTTRTNWLTGLGDTALAPGFTNVTTVSGTAGVVSSATLTDTSANFSNVTDNQDYLYIVTGSGVTVANSSSLIISHTSTSVTVAATIGGSGTNISYYVRTGQNFGIGTNLQGIGSPGTISGSQSIGYLDIGAVQRKVNVPAITDVRSGVVYDDLLKTGTAAIPSAANVRTGIAVDATVGTAAIPSPANVLAGIPVDATVGTLTVPTAAQVASAVWEEPIASHTTTSKFGGFVQTLLTLGQFLGLK